MSLIKTHDIQDIYHVLVHLRDYTVYHFAFEEKLMQQANYPKLEEHREIHKDFVKAVKHFKERYEHGEDITSELMRVLQVWLINHIENTDGDYAHDIQLMLANQKKEVEVVAKEEKQSWFSSLMSKLFKK